MSPEEKKTEEELREDIIKEHELDPDDERDSKIIEARLKDKTDRYDATNQKKKAQESLEKMTKGKDHYKKIAKTAKPAGEKPEGGGGEQPQDGEKPESNDKPLISEREVSILFGKGDLKYERELKELEKVMKITGKSAKDALNDSQFKTWRDNNDQLITSQGSQLPASKGGGNRGEAEEDAEFTKKAEQALNPKE